MPQDLPMQVFPEFAPDRNPGDGASYILNAIPAASGYVPLPKLEPWAANTLTDVRGLTGVRHPNGTAWIMAGDEASLYYLDSGTRTWTAATSTIPDYGLASGDRWSFAFFGDHLYATTIQERIQRALITGGSPSWDDASADAPKAKYLAVIKDWLFAANLEDDTDGVVPNRVQWSAVANGGSWPKDPRFLADFQDLQDSGEIVGLIGGDYGLVITTQGVWRIDYVGLPKIFDLRRIRLARGCVDAGSVTALDSVVMYLSDTGWILIRNGQAIEYPGTERIDRWFNQQINLGADPTMWASGNAQLDTFVIAYEGAQAREGYPNALLLYNYVLDRWSYAEVETRAMAQVWGTSYTLEGLDAVSTSLDDLPASLDSNAWTTGRGAVMTFDSAGLLSQFTGPPMDAVLETAELLPTGTMRHSAIAEAVPMIHTTSTAATITIADGQRNVQTRKLVWTADRKRNRDGVYNFRRESRFHTLRCKVSGGWSEAKGVLVSAEARGRS